MLCVNSDGTPYKSQHGLTCKSQVLAFTGVLEEMATHPEDYVSDHGRLTTNTVEVLHGLALVYRDKRTDLSHTHYVCKTNMVICHKIRGTITNIQWWLSVAITEPGTNIESLFLHGNWSWHAFESCHFRSKRNGNVTSNGGQWKSTFRNSWLHCMINDMVHITNMAPIFMYK